MATPRKPKESVPRWLWIDNEKFYLNSEKTAEFFNVSARTLLNWDEKSGGALKNSTGWWDIKAIMEWRNGEGEESDFARKLRAEADLKEEQVKEKKLENEILIGEYYKKFEVEQEWAMRIIEIKNSLLALSKKIGSEISDPGIRIEVEKMVAEEVYNYLDQYARTGKYTPKPKKRGIK
jgi:hypothetical protein